VICIFAAQEVEAYPGKKMKMVNEKPRDALQKKAYGG